MPSLSIDQAQSLKESQAGIKSSYFGMDSLMENAEFSKSAALLALNESGGGLETGVHFEELNVAFDKLMQDGDLQQSTDGHVVLSQKMLEQEKRVIPSGVDGLLPLNPPLLPVGKTVDGVDVSSGSTGKLTTGTGSSNPITLPNGNALDTFESRVGNPSVTKYLHENVEIDPGKSVTLKATDTTGAEAYSTLSMKDLKSFTYTLERSTISPALHVGTFLYVDKPGDPNRGAEADFGEILPDYGELFHGRNASDFTFTFHDPHKSGANNLELKNIVDHGTYDASLWGAKSPEDSKTMTFRYEFGKDDGTVKVYAQHLDTKQWVEVASLQNDISETALESGKLIFSTWREKDVSDSLNDGAFAKFSNIQFDYY